MARTTTPVVISGIGVVSPLGCSVEELARRFAAGKRAVQVNVDGEDMARVEDVPLDLVPAERRSRLGRLDRLCRIVLSASALATESAGLSTPFGDGERAGISIGTGLGCLLTDEEYYRRIVVRGPAAASPQLFSYTVSSAAAGEASIVLGIKGPNVTAHMGFAAGLGAVGYGFDLVQMGKADVVLAGGADVIGAPLVRALRAMKLIKTPREARPLRDRFAGVWPSEGAAVFVLEREDRAARRGARAWGSVNGYAAGFEPGLTRAASAGDALVQTLRRALMAGGVGPADVGLVVSSAHGTPIDEAENDAITAALGTDVEIVHPKQALGETFGASGPLGLALALGMEGESRCVLVSNVCYSGNAVALVATRGYAPRR
jgi:3-oxoacyl-[acyl-carrier-protein] synthase II